MRSAELTFLADAIEADRVIGIGSTAPERRYLRIVFRDSPVRREVPRIEIPSRLHAHQSVCR